MSDAACYIVKGSKTYFVTMGACHIIELARELEGGPLTPLDVATSFDSFGDNIEEGKVKRAKDGSFEIVAHPVDSGLYVVDVNRKILINGCGYYSTADLKRKLKGWELREWSPKVKV